MGLLVQDALEQRACRVALCPARPRAFIWEGRACPSVGDASPRGGQQGKWICVRGSALSAVHSLAAAFFAEVGGLEILPRPQCQEVAPAPLL